jgi:aryl carrier-like protein
MNNSDFKKRIDNLSPGQRKLLAGQIGAPKGRPGDYQGRRIVAYVVGEANMSPAGLRNHLKDRLPDYMVPAAFVILDEMPRLPNGKLDLNALPAPSEIAAAPESSYVAPRTPVEQQLAEIWEEVLNFQPVGIHDNFFEIGGDSILSIQIVSKARKVGLSLGPNQLFEHQTIAELALFVQPEKEQSSKDEPVTGPLPLTPIQHWFFEEYRAAPHHWNQGITFNVSPQVNAGMVKQAIQQLIRSHDALRLQFAPVGKSWEAVILEPEKMDCFQHIDLSSLSLPEQDRLIQEKSDSLQAAFRFSEGSLFHCVFFTCEPAQRNQLLLAAHHLLVDAVSWQILVEDLNTALTQLSRGEKISLPAKTNSYKSWSEHLAALAQAGKFREEYGFWQAQTSNAQSFPADFEIKLPVPEESIETLTLGWMKILPTRCSKKPSRHTGCARMRY